MTPTHTEGLAIQELRARATRAGLAVQIEALTPKLADAPGLKIRFRFYPLGQGTLLADYTGLPAAWAYLSGFEAARDKGGEA